MECRVDDIRRRLQLYVELYSCTLHFSPARGWLRLARARAQTEREESQRESSKKIAHGATFLAASL